MAFQPVPNCAEIALHGTLNGESCVTTFYARFATTPTNADLVSLLIVVDGWVTADWLPAMPPTYQLASVSARGLSAAIDAFAESSDSAGAGTATPATAPNNRTLSVKRSSGLTGRGARGRIFIPAIPDLQMSDDNHVRGTFASALADVLNLFRTTIATVNWTEVIVHRVAAGVPLPTAVAFTVLEYTVVDLVIDSMRRRLPGRGA